MYLESVKFLKNRKAQRSLSLLNEFNIFVMPFIFKFLFHSFKYTYNNIQNRIVEHVYDVVAYCFKSLIDTDLVNCYNLNNIQVSTFKRSLLIKIKL